MLMVMWVGLNFHLINILNLIRKYKLADICHESRQSEGLTDKTINSFGAKFQTTFVVCFFILRSYRLEKNVYM